MYNATMYQLGIIFSIGSYSKKDKRIVFRHKDKYFLEQLQSLFPNTIYRQKAHNSEQYVAKVPIDIEELKSLGWSTRNAEIRNIPILKKYKDFLRAYMEIHSKMDYCTAYSSKRKYYRLRLRIYGNINIMESINNILYIETGVKKKSIYITTNGKTSIISYTNLEEIEKILKYLEGKPHNEMFWENAYNKLKEPRIYKKEP